MKIFTRSFITFTSNVTSRKSRAFSHSMSKLYFGISLKKFFDDYDKKYNSIAKVFGFHIFIYISQFISKHS